jgi:glutaredoxin
MRKLWVAVALVLAVAGGAHAGKLYKWVDKDGNVSYHDRPPPNGGDYRVEERSLRGVGAIEKPGELEAIVEKNPVVLYAIPVCGGCDQARAYLQKRQVPFKEINLETDAKTQQEIKKKLGSLSAPTITVGEKIMKGYVESLLEGELDSAGYPKTPGPDQETRPTGGLAPTR